MPLLRLPYPDRWVRHVESLHRRMVAYDELGLRHITRKGDFVVEPAIFPLHCGGVQRQSRVRGNRPPISRECAERGFVSFPPTGEDTGLFDGWTRPGPKLRTLSLRRGTTRTGKHGR